MINDDLTGSVLVLGALIAGIGTGAVGYGIGYGFYHDDPDKDVADNLPLGLSGFGLVVGLILCLCTMTVVSSAIITLFVCFAEDPAVLKKTHHEEFEMLVEAHPKFADIGGNVSDYSDYGGNESSPMKSKGKPDDEAVAV